MRLEPLLLLPGLAAAWKVTAYTAAHCEPPSPFAQGSQGIMDCTKFPGNTASVQVDFADQALKMRLYRSDDCSGVPTVGLYPDDNPAGCSSDNLRSFEVVNAKI